METCKKLASHHILRRNRLIDNLIHQFSPEDKDLPTEGGSCSHFCKHMQRCVEIMRECNSQESLDGLLGTMEDFIYTSKTEVMIGLDMLSIKVKHPKEYTFLCRCKKTIDAIKHLRESLRRVPNEMPKKFHPRATKCDLKKDKGKLVVYFNAATFNCSGWLDVNNDTDVLCFNHAMGGATEFDTPEEAVAAAEERLKKIELIYIKCTANPPLRGNPIPQKTIAEQMAVYKYFILRKEEKKDEHP